LDFHPNGNISLKRVYEGLIASGKALSPGEGMTGGKCARDMED
jgi:hypothetical protein